MHCCAGRCEFSVSLKLPPTAPQSLYTNILFILAMKPEGWWWGRSASVDLHDCNPKLVRDPKAIKRFVRELCQVIKMKRHGPTEVQRFGQGQLRGYSMMQFIETSSVVGHFDEKGKRAFIDVFSCKQFDPKIVAHFAKKFFRAKNCSLYVEERL